MRQNWIRITINVCFILLLPACSQVDAPAQSGDTPAPRTSPSPVASSPTESETTPPTRELDMTQSTPPPGMESLIERAKEDLAHRLSISVSQISLEEAKAVVWPDSSLGCPQPGMRYKQVPEDGALIVLEAQETTYEYHSGGSRGLFLCEIAYKDPNPPSQIDIIDLTPQLLDNKTPPPTTPDNSIPPGEDQ